MLKIKQKEVIFKRFFFKLSDKLQTVIIPVGNSIPDPNLLNILQLNNVNP